MKNSRYSKEGIHCQSCHMPDRKHLFKGIHDPETTRKAIKIETVEPGGWFGNLNASIKVTNIGAGHAFPTYVTPEVWVSMVQLDKGGREIPSTFQSYAIARRVKLDLSAEISDTRLLPGESVEVEYEDKKHKKAVKLKLAINVHPDAFYTGFYRSWLSGKRTTASRRLLQMALEESLANQYPLFEKTYGLD